MEHSKESPPLNVLVNPMKPTVSDDVEDVDVDVQTDFQQPSTSSVYVPPHTVNTNPILVNQSYLNDKNRQLLWHYSKITILLGAGVTISSQKKRQAKFIPFFKFENDISFCSDIRGLMDASHIAYDINNWRLYIDASKSVLKAFLLHNDNIRMPVPVAYSRVLKETYAPMKIIFDKKNAF